MRFATARTVTLQGATGHLIDVQVDLSAGLVKTAMVGRPDASISDGRDRCRAALTNSHFEWPATRRVTISLSPADLPKRGPHFDLAIAVGVLGASDQLPRLALEGMVFIGELTLDGRLRCVPGVLPMVMAAAARGIRRVVVPEPQADEAAMVPGMAVLGVRSLRQVVAELRDEPVPCAPPVEPLASGPLLSWRGEARIEDLDMRDVLGMADTRYAIEVAAAGGHHLLLSGPKGAGKTTLAERVSGLLPDLTVEESLELSAIYSLAGCLPAEQKMITRPPFRAPHHSASRTSVLGGGSGRVRPGEVSRAHTGTLFLDEFPLFSADIIEALRQPLESGEITIARGEETATFPARTMFVIACNPCPCGDYHPHDRDNRCSCTEVKRREYRKRISGPIADRIDITRHVEPVRPDEMLDPLARPESTHDVRRRVTAARALQAERYAGTAWRLNSDVPGPSLRESWPLTGEADRLLLQHVYSGKLTRRGATRVHRLAWTVADLAGVGDPGVVEVHTALRLRGGEPLNVAELETARAR
ncbi:MAG: MG(2+) CHELATASE FAMILY PROTEIN / ComM-related protein [uncultured Nocardioidaceae bacterium]|uniref:MG(2+) CHELATASE FAMILY PROTEIN / ComM-related protein n=1 Tax=uncultured Nocardioidaceae bacterium TaxID=253824 RepID=A0A6J4MFC1_9ACTN|nr:MAG: MG(2+) CHELATASE FAMILY PROTEIN / ComM-related protein [uncultured Nocardioidaceae bacterium]